MTPLTLTYLVALSIIILGGLLGWGHWQSRKLPTNRPSRFIRKSDSSKLVVFVGDSITHGKLSTNFTAMVSQKLIGEDYEFVNAGINGELAWNITRRLDEVIKLNPDIVTLMVGTNDAMGSLTPKDAREYRKWQGLPQDPTVDWYQEMVEHIVSRLKEKTSAQIAIVSIPPLGEDPTHPAFIRSRELSEISKTIAKKFEIVYLPANEMMSDYILDNPSIPKSPFENRHREIFMATYKHYILRRSWDRISNDSGFNLLIDHIHLNSRAASMVMDLIYAFVSG